MYAENKQLMLRWFDEVWNKSNVNAIDEMMSADAEARGLGTEKITNREDFKAFHKSFNDNFANIHVVVENVFVDGDYAISLATVTGKERKTGKPVEFTGTSISLIKDGKITVGWNHYDFLAMYIQTGKIKQEQLR
jgi:ketosteroid isomerase-like protein